MAHINCCHVFSSVGSSDSLLACCSEAWHEQSADVWIFASAQVDLLVCFISANSHLAIVQGAVALAKNVTALALPTQKCRWWNAQPAVLSEKTDTG